MSSPLSTAEAAKSNASNVWACICSYNTDTAKDLTSKHGYSAESACQTLTRYPGVHLYHGHRSGGMGDGENEGAAANRAAAIEYLKAQAKVGTSKDEKKAGPDLQKKKANIKHSDQMIKMINEGTGNFGDLAAALDEFDPNWRKNGTVSKHFDLLKAQKKAAKQGSGQKK